MYVDYDLLQYVGTLKRNCRKCGFVREHQVDVLRDREPDMMVLTCLVCKRRQGRILSAPVTIPEPNALEPVLTD